MKEGLKGFLTGVIITGVTVGLGSFFLYDACNKKPKQKEPQKLEKIITKKEIKKQPKKNIIKEASYTIWVGKNKIKFEESIIVSYKNKRTTSFKSEEYAGYINGRHIGFRLIQYSENEKSFSVDLSRNKGNYSGYDIVSYYDTDANKTLDRIEVGYPHKIYDKNTQEGRKLIRKTQPMLNKYWKAYNDIQEIKKQRIKKEKLKKFNKNLDKIKRIENY